MTDTQTPTIDLADARALLHSQRKVTSGATVTAEKAGVILGVSRRTVQRLMGNGTLIAGGADPDTAARLIDLASVIVERDRRKTQRDDAPTQAANPDAGTAEVFRDMIDVLRGELEHHRAFAMAAHERLQLTQESASTMQTRHAELLREADVLRHEVANLRQLAESMASAGPLGRWKLRRKRASSAITSLPE